MNIHFIGIGGTAMGAVAVACARQGHAVSGSDTAVYAPMSEVLWDAGIDWYDGFSADALADKSPDLVVIGNAISRGNTELEFVLDNRISYTSMAAFVGTEFISKNTSIVVAGTHGKTTTASMTAWLLESAQRQPGFLIGGVPAGFSAGCRPVPPHAHDTYAGVFVSEGDEYDTAFFDKRSKFVHYRPTVAIVNNIEFDHADIFRNLDDILTSFNHLIRIVPRNGLVLANADDENAATVTSGIVPPVQLVGFDAGAFWNITNVQPTSEFTSWTLLRNGEHYGTFALAMPGMHNIRNASMAIAATAFVGLTVEEQTIGISSFNPPKRRLQNIGSYKSNPVVDDFAHHPTAIAATIAAIQQLHPGKTIHSVFEPRSNTTTRSFFQKELAECFNGSASVCIGPVNRPERYKPEERLDTSKLTQDLQSMGINALCLPPERSQDPDWGADVLAWLNNVVADNNSVIVIMSNGNVGGLRAALSFDPQLV